MYLTAIKTIVKYCGAGKVVVIDDGLDDSDRQHLNDHVRDIKIIKCADIETGKCPKGSCWERLFAIIYESQERFVIQVDSDILALKELPLVQKCVDTNQSFTLCTKATPDFVSLLDIGNSMWRQVEAGDRHVQPVAEAHFRRLSCAETGKYIRGCAGFCGFAKGSISREFIEEFSERLESLIGQKWHEWGSEQVASNYAIANSPNPVALPLKEYTNFGPETDLEIARVIHFMGSYRFNGGVYRRLAARTIERLREHDGS